jgi:hypothetical protein
LTRVTVSAASARGEFDHAPVPGYQSDLAIRVKVT